MILKSVVSPTAKVDYFQSIYFVNAFNTFYHSQAPKKEEKKEESEEEDDDMGFGLFD